MNKLIQYSVLSLALALGSSTFAHAETVTAVYGGNGWWSWWFPPPPPPPPPAPKSCDPGKTAPEVDPSLALSGFALLGGTLTVLRARRKK